MATSIIRGLINVPATQRSCVVTIGNFDGVHLGHQALLARVKEQARFKGVPAIAIVFEPQPAEFFAQQQAVVPRLTRWREKFHALARCGMDSVLVLRFNAKLAQLSADEFVRTILQQGLAVQHVIVGDDFRFGKGRQGDIDFLKQVGAQYGFSAEAMPSVLIENERVSSTRIRLALAQGDHVLAARLLGRPYSMEGRVVRGDQRGRSIGFPTANIYLHRQATPVQGVYVVRMQGLAQSSLPGVANVGIRPTVGGTRSLLEVHLFDFDQDIYGKQVRIEFCEKLRDEKRFDNFDLLKEQIWKDAEQAKKYFSITSS